MVVQDTQDRLNLDEYDTLKFRVFGDGRKYLASIRTENWIIGDHSSADVYQAFLFARCITVCGSLLVVVLRIPHSLIDSTCILPVIAVQER